MCNHHHHETDRRINQQQRTIIYDDVNHALEQLRYTLVRLTDYAPIIGEPTTDQLRVLERDTIRCVHAFTEASRALLQHRRDRTPPHMIPTEKPNLDHARENDQPTTHPLAGTINNTPETRFNRTGEFHDTDTPKETSPHRYTDNQ